MKKVILIHGWGGYPGEGWFPWLKKELENKGFEVETPQMPDTENPKIDAWVGRLQEVVGDVNEDTYFIGHSMGAQTVLRYLEKLPEDKKVGGIIFIAGWFNLTDEAWDEKYTKELASPWINTPINLEKIKNHTDKLVAMFSDDDPYVPLSDKKLFEQKLGTKTIILNNRSHFDEIVEFPELLNSILDMSK